MIHYHYIIQIYLGIQIIYENPGNFQGIALIAYFSSRFKIIALRHKRQGKKREGEQLGRNK